VLLKVDKNALLAVLSFPAAACIQVLVKTWGAESFLWGNVMRVISEKLVSAWEHPAGIHAHNLMVFGYLTELALFWALFVDMNLAHSQAARRAKEYEYIRPALLLAHRARRYDIRRH